MKSTVLFSCLAFGATSVFATGCSGSTSSDESINGDDVSVEEALKANVTAGKFNLYLKPAPACDLYTALELKADYYSTATLEEVNGGSCRIHVARNTRTYRLRADGTSCGSRMFAGSVTKNGNRSTIKITDHRSRTCRDIVPAKIIVEETTANGITTKKYSNDSALRAVWPTDATTLIAETNGGGFTPTPPAGSTCTFGMAKYTLDVKKASLAWKECEFINWNTPLTPKSGTLALGAAAMEAIAAAASEVQVSSSTICGTDKPLLTMTVKSPSQGTTTYKDSFYACSGDGPFVDNIGAVFGAFRKAVAEGEAAATRKITDADNGKTFTFKQGQDVGVALSLGSSPGYKWSVTQTDRSFGYPRDSFVTYPGNGTELTAFQSFVWDTKNDFALGEHTVVCSFARAGEASVKKFVFTVNVVN